MSDDIGKSVRDRLAATTQVTDIVGSRIYADVREQGASLPQVVVYVLSSTAYEDLNSSNRMLQATIRVAAYGKIREQANALAKAIRDNALAADLSGSIEGMDWKECSLVGGPAELVEPPQDGSDTYTRVTDQQFSIWASPL